MRYDLISIGEVLVDFTPCGKGVNGFNLFEQNPGGAPANVVAAFAKYGASSAFISKVGQDIFGDFLVQQLQAVGVDTSGIARDEVHNTTLAFVEIDDTGDRKFSFYRRFGADVFLSCEDINLSMLDDCRIFHFGSLSLTNEPSRSATEYALKAAVDKGCVISFDPNYRPMLWDSREKAVDTIKQFLPYADILKVSEEEAEMLCGIKDLKVCAKQLTENGRRIVSVTMGKDGCIIAGNNFAEHYPSQNVKTIDTTGAGDIFFATFLYEIISSGKSVNELKKDDFDVFMPWVTKAAAYSTTIKGAIPSIPDYIKDFRGR